MSCATWGSAQPGGRSLAFPPQPQETTAFPFPSRRWGNYPPRLRDLRSREPLPRTKVCCLSKRVYISTEIGCVLGCLQPVRLAWVLFCLKPQKKLNSDGLIPASPCFLSRRHSRVKGNAVSTYTGTADVTRDTLSRLSAPSLREGVALPQGFASRYIEGPRGCPEMPLTPYSEHAALW